MISIDLKFAVKKSKISTGSMNFFHNYYVKDIKFPDIFYRGLYDMSACQYGSPIVLSWPHFYDSDEMNGKVKVFEITNLEEILGIQSFTSLLVDLR